MQTLRQYAYRAIYFFFFAWASFFGAGLFAFNNNIPPDESLIGM